MSGRCKIKQVKPSANIHKSRDRDSQSAVERVKRSANRHQNKSEEIHLLEAPPGPSVHRTVVVYQRFALPLLRFKPVRVLPGCKERNQSKIHRSQKGSFGQLLAISLRNQTQCCAHTFTDKEFSHVEGGLDCRPRVWNVRPRPFKCIFLRMPLRPINWVIIRWPRG